MLSQIEFRNIRNKKYVSFDFNKNIAIFCGLNGAGKTTILESIYFASYGKSFKTKDWRGIINKESKTAYLLVGYNFKNFIEINISLNKQSKINGNISTWKKNLSVSHPIVIDQKVITEFKNSKKIRLNLFDKLISIDKKIYSSILAEFSKLKKILIKAREKVKFDDSFITVVAEQLSKTELEIIFYRKEFSKKIDELFFQNTYKYLKQEITLNYEPIKKEENILKELLVASMTTVSKDDWKIYKGVDNYLKFSSGGEIKITILILIISYIEIIKREFNQDFPLLLDDIFSELDDVNQKLLLKILIEKKINAFITTQSINHIYNKKDIQIINMEGK